MASTQTQLFDEIMDAIDEAKRNGVSTDEVVGALEDALSSVEDESTKEI